MNVDEYKGLAEGTRVFCLYAELDEIPDDSLSNYDLMLTDYKLEPDSDGNVDYRYQKTFDRSLNAIFRHLSDPKVVWAIIIAGMPVAANLVATYDPPPKG